MVLHYLLTTASSVAEDTSSTGCDFSSVSSITVTILIILLYEVISIFLRKKVEASGEEWRDKIDHLILLAVGILGILAGCVMGLLMGRNIFDFSNLSTMGRIICGGIALIPVIVLLGAHAFRFFVQGRSLLACVANIVKGFFVLAIGMGAGMAMCVFLFIK